MHQWASTNEGFPAAGTSIPVVDRHGMCYWLPLPADLRRLHRLELMHGREPAGMIEVSWTNAEIIGDFGILIDAPYRQRGLGTALLHTLLHLGYGHGARLVYGYVRHDDLIQRPFLLDWYRREGFQVTREDGPLRAASLALNLTPEYVARLPGCWNNPGGDETARHQSFNDFLMSRVRNQ